MKSRYLDAFMNSPISLTGNYILVEEVEPPEKRTKSGIFLGDDGTNNFKSIGNSQPTFFVVVAVGPGYYNEEGGIIDNSMLVSPGNVVLIPNLSVNKFSWLPYLDNYSPDSLGISRDTEIQMKFDSITDFLNYFGNINDRAEFFTNYDELISCSVYQTTGTNNEK